MSKGKEIKVPAALEALEAAGFARDVAEVRLRELSKRYGALTIPIEEVVNLLKERVTPEIIEKLLRQGASDLLMLVSTGKSKIERDDSAVA